MRDSEDMKLDSNFVGSYRVNPVVMNSTAIRITTPKILPMNDMFLDYLECVELPRIKRYRNFLLIPTISFGVALTYLLIGMLLI